MSSDFSVNGYGRQLSYFLSFICGTVLFYLFHFFPVTTALLFTAATAVILLKGRALLLPLIIIGFFYAYARYSPDPDLSGFSRRELSVTGRFVELGSISAEGPVRETFRIYKAFDGPTGAELHELEGVEVVLYSEFRPEMTSDYEIILKTGSDRTRYNPGGFRDSVLYGSLISARELPGKAYSLRSVFDEYRRRMNYYVLSRFSPDSAALIISVTTGETGFLSGPVREAFNVTGLAHILSISGTHFGLFSAMIFGSVFFLVKRLPYRLLQRLTLYLTPLQASAISSIPFMIMYLGISGASVPAVRSFVMITLFLAGLLMGRKGFWLNSLLFAACIIILLDPGAVLSVSFQLSFIAVLCIGLFMDMRRVMAGDRETRERSAAGKVLHHLMESLALSLSASLGTSVLVAFYFHYVSLISPVSNLLVAPLIGLMLVPLALISSFCFLATGSYILAPLVSLSADLSVGIVKLLATFPFADVKITAFPAYLCILFYAGLLIYLLTGTGKFLFIPVLPVAIFGLLLFFEKGELCVTFLDVGQGDSAVIELPDARTIVVDAGSTGRETGDFLRFRGKRNIEALVMTHVHPDHSGGVQYLLERFNVKELWDNGMVVYPDKTELWPKHRSLSRGDIIEAAGVLIEVLHPYTGFYTMEGSEYDAENNASLVIKVTGKGMSYLFSGDVADEAEYDLSHLGKWLQADIIKIPHHGSRTSMNTWFLTEVAPSLAVISAGRNNAFGHPSPEVLEALGGRMVFRTDLDGAIKISSTGRGPLIKTARYFRPEHARDFGRELKNLNCLFSSW